MTDENALITTLVAAAKRHDNMLNSYSQAFRSLTSEIRRTLDPLRIRSGAGSVIMFSTRVDTGSGTQALIIKINITSGNHAIGTSVLNFQTAGLDYSPIDGSLCGFVQVILSKGDYWEKLKPFKISTLVRLAVGQIESIEDISLEVLDIWWITADNPNQWLRFNANKQEEPVVIKDYIYFLLDQVYNPEYKGRTHNIS